MNYKLITTTALGRLLGVVLLICISQNQGFGQSLQATAANTPAFTPQNLIENVFLGQGVEVSNITYNGDNVAVGYFTGGQNSVGIDRGIIMTTGRAATQGTNYGCNSDGADFANFSNSGGSTEPDLAPLITVGLNDVAVFTITFIPTSDTLRFRYCFASEEYPEFACSPYNDVFGFFIQGPGFPTPTNIAKIPNTNLPVTINNIHPSNPAYFPCPAKNAQYYNGNNTTSLQPTYDGYTDVFIAQAIVTPCQEYTIKLAIADASDSAYDSGVFLEAKSFGTGSIRTEVSTVSLDGSVSEGCAKGTVTFELPNTATQNYPLDYNIWGSATNGVDYQPIPLNQFIPAGNKKISFDIIALEDLLPEGVEFIAIDYKKDPCNRDTIYLNIRENSLMPPMLRPDTSICSGGQPLNLDGTLSIPVPPPFVFTNTTDLSIAPINTPVISTISVNGVTPLLLDSGMIRSVCINVNHNWVDDLDIFLIAPGGKFIELTTDNGADGNNYTQTCFTPLSTKLISFPGPFAPASAAPFTGDFQPEGVWSDLWGGPVNGDWKLQIVDDQNGFVGALLDWSITFEPSYKVNYQWSPANGLSCATCPITDATPLQSTLYKLLATDTYGCAVSDSVDLTVNPALAPPAIECGNSTKSSVTFTWPSISGASGYEINTGNGWIPLQMDTFYTVTGLLPSSVVNAQIRGINTFQLCGANIGTGSCVNCSPPGVSAATTPVSCFNGTNGAVTITTDNINPPYAFRVSTFSNMTGIFNNLSAGDYVATITDGVGCDTLLNFNIGTPAALTPTIFNTQNVSCFGGTNGILSAAITGGTMPYTYLWSNGGQTTSSANNLAAGTYAVTITDANNCSITAPGSITAPPILAASATSTPVKCNGTPTGLLNSSGTGGTLPFSYLWSGGQTTATVSNVLAGNYILSITDGKGCVDTVHVALVEPAPLTVSITNTPANCSNNSDGTATAFPLGGTTPFSYKWSNSPAQTTPTATGLSAIIYTVTVTDANNCTATSTTTIGSPAPLTLTIGFTPVSCNGGNNGTATVVPTGGNGNFKYAWNASSQTTATATGLSFGQYTVTVTDIKGCINTTSVNVTQPAALLPNITTVKTKCYDSMDGSAKVNLIGGTIPYTYVWSSGEITQGIDNKFGGIYTVTVTDANNCTVTASATIAQPPKISSFLTPKNVLCFNGLSGSITTQITGGAGGYSVVWFGPDNFIATTPNIDTLAAGNYQITITDVSGCSATANTTLNQPLAPLQLVIPYISDTVCFDASTGATKVFPQGGTTPYSYLWDDPNAQTTQSAINLPVDTYRVTVTDANGCTTRDSTFIYQKNPLFVYVTPHLPRCYNGMDGYATVDFVSYGSTPFDADQLTYVWDTDPPQFGKVADNLSYSTIYMVTATDNEGCTATQMVPIENQVELTGFFTTLENIDCHGANTGTATINGKGGTEPYSYFWDPGVSAQTDPFAKNLIAGDYRVTITDFRTCQTVVLLTLTEPTPLENLLSPKDVPCFGAATGQISAVPSGGVAPYTFLWENGQTSKTLTNVLAETYSITLTDANGCTRVDSTEINQPDRGIGAAIVKQDATCFGSANGRLEMSNASGGTPPYLYTLDNRPYNGSPLQIGLKAGTYIPRIKDANGCITELPAVTLTQRQAIEIDLGPEISIELGKQTQLTVDVMNAQSPFNLKWNAEDSLWLSCLTCPNPFVDSLYQENTFEVYIVDALGCIGENSITVKVLKPRRIYVPTGFTPNDDNNNDILLVHGQESAKILDFRVFDRWGEMVFQSKDFTPNDVTAGWDGTFRDKPMLPDVYVWVLEVEYLDGYKEVLHGQSTIIR
jgi:gliding motility-associated-like protein